MNVYASHFGLSTGPFGLTPDPAFLYLSPGHREALAAVQCGLLERRGFVTLVGEVGTGKTTLLYSLLSELDKQIDVAFVGFTAQTFEDLLAAALTDLGVTPPVGSRFELLRALNRHLLLRFAEGRTVALVIDEAQNLSDEAFEELRLLSNFETYSQKLLQTVLVGQTELDERLRRPHLRQLRQRVSVRATIAPLSSAETQRYITHRLAQVGGSADLLSRGARRLIGRRAGGIPRQINILCHSALLFAYAAGLRNVPASMARRAIDAMDAHARSRRRIGMLEIAAGSVAAAAALVAVAGGAMRFGARAPDHTAVPSVATSPVPAAVPPPPVAVPPAAVTAPRAPAAVPPAPVATPPAAVPRPTSADEAAAPTSLPDAGVRPADDAAPARPKPRVTPRFQRPMRMVRTTRPDTDERRSTRTEDSPIFRFPQEVFAFLFGQGGRR